MPAVWHCRGDVLRVAEEVRGFGSDRGARAASAARGERTAEEAGGRSDVGQAPPDGGGAKKAPKPARRRELATWIYEGFKVSKARACRLALLSLSTFYRKCRAPQQLELRRRIREIATARPRFGYQRIHILLRREGWQINHKRVHRLYCLEGRQVRMRVRRRKRLSLHRGPAPVPEGRDDRWSMDFVHDQLTDGRSIRMLTVVDQ